MSTGVVITGVLFVAVWLGGRWLAWYERHAPQRRHDRFS